LILVRYERKVRVMLNEFVLGITISISLTPIWYIVVEILDKFYQAFIVRDE